MTALADCPGNDHDNDHETSDGEPERVGSNALVLTHPVVADRLRVLRDKHTDQATFVRVAAELSTLVAYEATRTLGLEDTPVDTPVMAGARAQRLAEKILVVPILRAGLGMSQAVTDLLPGSAVAHVGLRRDEETLASVIYMNLLPDDLSGCTVVICDPMVATGGSLSQVCGLARDRGARSVLALCLLASVPGVAHMAATHPDVRLVCAGMDDHLDERGYITPGLGDAGDRLFGLAP